MIAEISINEQLIALPMALVGFALCIYSVWPDAHVRQIALICGLGCLVGAVVFLWFGDAPAIAPSRPVVPNAPVVVPATGKLADKVPKEVRGKIGRYYLELADTISQAANLKTTEDLRNAYVSASKLMKDVCDLPEGLAIFRDATDAMFKEAIGLESQPLTPAIRDKFTATCRTIAAELGVTP